MGLADSDCPWFARSSEWPSGEASVNDHGDFCRDIDERLTRIEATLQTLQKLELILHEIADELARRAESEPTS